MGRILEFLQNIKFADIADITIIAVFLYSIMVWLKKARARFIFIGMVILGIVFILARFFGLYLTVVALQAFFAVALIMMIIIFQDDLRRLFEKIAILGVRRKRRIGGPVSQNVEIIASALANLSRKNMGALVVVKGSELLDRNLEAGVVLDAVISQVLLESIFDKHTPSHDGAVIIDGDRIVKLGTYLPLSTNIKEVGRLGTRHAAALGIAERTDALALVVSEEDGVISAAEDGGMKHLKDTNQLMNVLQDFYRKKYPEKKGLRLRQFFTEHLLERAIAVIIACTLWVVFAHHTGNVRRDFIVPIEYRNLAANRIVNEPKTKEVTVTLSGTEQKFNLLKPGDLKVSLDMSAIKDGENQITLTNDLVKNYSGLSVVNINPSQITLNSYRLTQLTVPIELKTKGKSPSGIVLKDAKIEPNAISVMVPSTLPKEKVVIATEPIDLSTITETTSIKPTLILPANVRFSEEKPSEIKVVFEVEKKEKTNEH
jgi:diadenylate cyclase